MSISQSIDHLLFNISL